MTNEPTPSQLEDRLGEALRHLAAQASASPDALERVEARWEFARADAGRGRLTKATASGRARRWALVPAVVMVVLAVVVALVVSRSKTVDSYVVAPTHPGPRTGSLLPAVGALAYVSGGRLWISDDVRTVSLPAPRLNGATVSSVNWSADGAYVSYVINVSGQASADLHVVASNGNGDSVVLRGRIFATAWAGEGHVLAASMAPGPSEGGLVVLTPGGPTRQVVAKTALVFSFRWARRGSALAYSVARGGVLPDQVHVVDVVSGGDTVVGDGPSGAGVLVAGWWPGDDGLLWWVDPSHSVSIEADGLMLQSVAVHAGHPVDLLPTAVYLPWLAWSPDGVTLAVVTGGGRFPWDAKHLALCQPLQGTCRVVPTPDGTVSFDPAWAPDGRHLAFVRAAEAGTAGAGSSFVSWYPSRRLWTSAADGSAQAPVSGAAAGVAAVSWASPDLLRYSTAESIEVIKIPDGTPVPVVRGLSGGSAGAGPDAYGKQPWAGVALWRP